MGISSFFIRRKRKNTQIPFIEGALKKQRNIRLLLPQRQKKTAALPFSEGSPFFVVAAFPMVCSDYHPLLGFIMHKASKLVLSMNTNCISLESLRKKIRETGPDASPISSSSSTHKNTSVFFLHVTFTPLP